MQHSTVVGEVIATRMPEDRAGVRVVRRHHLMVRWSHWLNVPILLGLILSGVSIYWASPVYQHTPDPLTGSVDPLADLGVWICAHVPGLHHYSSPPDWVYNHISLGPGMLAVALRLHCRVGHGRWLALSAAPPDGLARCTKDVLVLHRRSFRQTNAPHLAASAFQHKIQRTSTRRLFFRSGRRALIDPYRMGHSQTHAALLADLDFWWL